MLTYGGIQALSDFRRSKLLKQLQAVDSNITDVQAEFIHFVDTKDKLASADSKKLEQLLTYDMPFNGKRTGQLFVVTPRPGTISPWSTKATDIAHNCGLTSINRIERGRAFYITSKKLLKRNVIEPLLHDRMTDAVLENIEAATVLFDQHSPQPLGIIDVLTGGKPALEAANQQYGMALIDEEIEYLLHAYKKLGRNPTDAELMMFGVVNSEHCRHKIFNASWTVDGQKQPKSLFKMIKNTYEQNSAGILSAYSDNAAVIEGATAKRFFANPANNEYGYSEEPVHTVIKVETHNHPTAIAPFPGAATGTGGEIRDEGATGRGAKPKMGLAGYSVSNLQLSGFSQPWEKPYGKPDRIVSALDIMLEAPLGAAAYANEFGRPNTCGYFRTYEQEADGLVRGYHKPIMIAGGIGNIRDQHVQKRKLSVGAKLIYIGGPAMLIGLGGGTGASMESGKSGAELDFASVQRANAEIQRRVQEVIDQCWSLGDKNPIISIHDVGAGGICNALPELVHDSGLGAQIELRDVPNAEPGMSPREIWCNEAQERYVIGLDPKNLKLFTQLCERELCTFAVVGHTVAREHLTVTDRDLKQNVVDLPMSVLFGGAPKMERSFTRQTSQQAALKTNGIKLNDAVERVLHVPSVGSKQFLITIGDRNVGGLITRDQMVGPWQVPVSDVAVSANGFESSTGEAMAMGERSPLAVIDSSASARMAVGETLTNIVAASIEKLSDVKLSANWMAAPDAGNQDQALYDAVKALGEEFCPELGLTIPVGKDSLSMRTVWEENGKQKSVTSPLSVIISGFAPVSDINRTLTPQLQTDDDTTLLLIDLGAGWNRLGGSALAQAYNQVGNTAPDADPTLLKAFFAAIQTLNAENKLLAYHDRSDGGLFTTLCEMAFAAHAGLDITIPEDTDVLIQLFNEELGAVLQVKTADCEQIMANLSQILPDCVSILGKPTTDDMITINQAGQIIYQHARQQLQEWWSDTSYHVQSIRDNPACATREYEAISEKQDPGITPVINEQRAMSNEQWRKGNKPKVAIFRVQGVNGQVEMAAAFDRAGFSSIDVTLSDIASGALKLDNFSGLVACGGFSYGDVLGAGEGWAKSILFNPALAKTFKTFFERPDTFSLGVCNGCQMLSALKELIPGAEQWPRFLRNESEQFEARLTSVKIAESPSILLKGMAGSILPVPVAHGEGRAVFAAKSPTNLVAAQFVDNKGSVTKTYPLNPNGSKDGITALTTPDGRVTIMMPHPERAFLSQQLSWHPPTWGKESPWFQLFQNAREWVG
ncbi:MAG: phosphoribosylformylglycinamidine synthase [Patescibacteria group bacterium]